MSQLHLPARADRARLFLLLATGSLLAFATAARAATDTAVAGGATVDEVVVTAERHATNLEDTPIAISAFGARDLEVRRIDSLRDLAGQIPNFSIARVNISYTTQIYQLRGIGETDPIQEPVVAVYVDDVYQPRQIGSMLDLNDIQSIEVLRGPQGTLYGRNSSAGALRVLTNEPGKVFHTVESITYGSYDDLEARALVSGPLGQDLTASLSYVHHQRDGIDHDPTLGYDVNRIHLDSVRAKLRWTPGRWDFEGILTGMLDRSDTRAYIPVVQPGGGFSADTSYSAVPPLQHLNQAGGSLRALYNLTDHLKLKSITAYGGFDLNPVNYDNSGAAALIQKNLIHYNDQYVTQEIQFNGDFGNITFNTGFFYIHERFYVDRDGFSRRNALPTDPVANPANYLFLQAHNITSTNSYAVYGEAAWKLTSRLTLTGGLRVTIETKRFVFNNSNIDLQGDILSPQIDRTGAVVAGVASHTWSALTPKVSLAYKWTPDLLTYATFSEGFKSGGYDNRATLLSVAVLGFNPEHVDSYEAGLKDEFFAHRLRTNLALFYNEYKDLQVSSYIPQYLASVRGNAGAAHSEGVELEGSAKPVDRVTLQGSVGYLYAVYDTYLNAGGPGVNANGNPLINAPRWTLQGGVGYDLPIHIPGALRLAIDANWASKAYSSALARPQDLYPEQGYLNANLTWTSPDARWSATLSGKNILNSQKPVASSYTPSVGIWYYNFPDPATVTFTLKYQL